MANAPEALSLYAEVLAEEEGRPLPKPRSVAELRADGAVAGDMIAHMIALVRLPERVPAAAEW